MIRFKHLINFHIIRILFLVSIFPAFSQEIPQLDTLTLNTGLKIYFVHFGEDSLLNLRLVIDGGKKNETECQVGYSEVVQQLFEQSLKEKKFTNAEEANKMRCRISDGQTLLSTNCSPGNFDKEMELLSTLVSRLTVTKENMQKAVAAVKDRYETENMKTPALLSVYSNLVLYGLKHPLGRSYCQYQLDRALPSDIRNFYNEHYTPKRSSLVICGNFNTAGLKKTIAKHFIKWRALHNEENTEDHPIPEIPPIQNKTISFINRRGAKHYQLKWWQGAPAKTSPDYLPFLIVCRLFDNFSVEQPLFQKKTQKDGVQFKPIIQTGNFTEINSTAYSSDLAAAVARFDTLLHVFHRVKPTTAQLNEIVTDLKEACLKINTAEKVSVFYDPLIYNFEERRNYSAHLSAITSEDFQRVLKIYFNPDAYHLIIAGEESPVTAQLTTLKNITRYQASDFETCNEACKEVVIVKCHCQSCYERGQCYVWYFNPNQKDAIKSARARAKSAMK